MHLRHSNSNLVTTSTAARFLERAESTVRKLTKRGILQVAEVTETGIRLYARTELERYRREMKTDAKTR
jgi:hypothetical protein